jgi:2-keto-4-pentenoate hydratase/2-oxohepta-3-ene-1,7-dioic acid hydratase in catechol pathway
MKVARYRHDRGEQVGVVDGDRVVVARPGTTVLDLLAAPSSFEPAGAAVALADVQLLPPLQPPSIRDFVTFEQHVEGMVKTSSPDATIAPEWYEAPTFYFSNPHSLVASGEAVEMPPGSQLLDFELEIAAVVGAPARNVTVEQARNHIVGYTIFNDWSARDLQGREMRVMLGPAKGKDFAITLGPWIVSADELEPYRRADRLELELEVLVNGERIGGDTLASMAWSFEEMLAYAARGAWVGPGDLLGSGTCGGGCLGELWGRAGELRPPPLQVGDVVTMRAEGIGEIENRVVEGVPPVPVPSARRRAAS